MNKTDYETDLGYQVDLMRSTAHQPKGKLLADELAALGDNLASKRTGLGVRDVDMKTVSRLAAEIKNDPDELERFQWRFVLIKKSHETLVAVRDLCKQYFPYLADRLTVTIAQIKTKLAAQRCGVG